MRATDHIRLYIEDNTGEFDDYTDRLITANINVGISSYEGPYQLPDTGQLVVVSRNASLDPNVNQNIRFNSKIEIRYYEDLNVEDPNMIRLFCGFISDINIEYRPFGEEPIITINATDIIGQLQRYVLTEEDEQFCKDFAENEYDNNGEGATVSVLEELADLRFGGGSIYVNWFNYFGPQPIDPLARTFPKAGEKFLEILTKYCQSNLLEVNVVVEGYALVINPYYKNNPDLIYEYVYAEPAVFPLTSDTTFSDDGSENSYQAIKISNGFDRSINQVVINNNKRTLNGTVIEDTNSQNGPFNSTVSYNQWATANVAINTIFNDSLDLDNTYETLSYNIIENVSNANIEVSSITIDGLRYAEDALPFSSIYGLFNVGKEIRIKHQVSETIDIDRLYVVCGVQNAIDANNMYVTFSLKVSPKYSLIENLSQRPEFTITPTSGNTNTMFSATISNYNLSGVDYIGWDIAAENSPVGSTQSKDTNQIVGDSTPTWNYDFGGLAGDDYGAGFRYVRLWLRNSKKWNILTQIIENIEDGYLDVTSAEPNASFTYSVSGGQVTFTDTSYDADTWSWDFGDGTTSTLQNPTHTYTTSGSKTVSLTVGNGVSTNTHTKTIVISVIKIPVRWFKVEFKAIQTRPNSSTPWDKNLPLAFGGLIPLGPGEYLLSDTTTNESVTQSAKKEIVGTVDGVAGAAMGGFVNYYATNWTGTTPKPSGWQNLDWFRMLTSTGSSNLFHWVDINPTSTNGGNTREVDVSFYIKSYGQFDNLYNVNGFTLAFPTAIGARTGFPAETYYAQNTTYENIKIYISPSEETSFTNIVNDTSSWIEVGYVQIANITNIEASNKYFFRDMVATRIMPPQVQ
jgi:PKD repeat protein